MAKSGSLPSRLDKMMGRFSCSSGNIFSITQCAISRLIQVPHRIWQHDQQCLTQRLTQIPVNTPPPPHYYWRQYPCLDCHSIHHHHHLLPSFLWQLFAAVTHSDRCQIGVKTKVGVSPMSKLIWRHETMDVRPQRPFLLYQTHMWCLKPFIYITLMWDEYGLGLQSQPPHFIAWE